LSTVQLHRLLAAILRAQADQQLDLPVLVVGLLRVAVPAELWENPPAWPAWRQLLPHVLVATDPHRSLTGAAGEQTSASPTPRTRSDTAVETTARDHFMITKSC
jgi:hypothetical protein